jgi:hypothetical protein
MVLENVKEMWTETPRNAQGKKGRPVNKDRFISKMYAFSNVKWTPARTDSEQVPARGFGYFGAAQLMHFSEPKWLDKKNTLVYGVVWRLP